MLLRQITKDLFREKTRIMLTILAIAWGTFAIASMLAIGEGLRVTFAQTVANTGHNLLSIRGGRITKDYNGAHAGVKINLTKDDYKAIARLPNIDAITPQHTLSAKLSYGDKISGMSVLAVETNYNKIHEIEVMAGGRFISPLDIKRKTAVIVLGTKAAEDFFPHKENPVGEYVKIGTKPFLVIGVMQHKSQLISRRGSDASNNWVPISTYDLYANPQTLDGIDITYKNPALLEQLEQHIQQIVALNHKASPADDNLVHFSEFSKRQDKINSFFLGMQVFLGIIGALTLLVAGVGIANVMFASVYRATHEIGIRIAIGARTYHIIRHYILEALAATFIGGLLGLAAATLLVYGLRQVPMKGKLIEVIGQPKPVLSLTVMVVVILVLGIIGFFAGLFPALKASRIDPAEALTYE